MERKRLLTGDRPTGPLHLGHYVGSLQNRLKLQSEYETFIIIADVQALTDNYANPDKVRANVLEVYKDYYAVGLDFTKVHIFIQSLIPEIAELTIFFTNLVSHAEVLRNPTVKTEILEKDLTSRVPLGFVMYPVSQAADILFCKANLVPVGQDQAPMIEIAKDIALRFNKIYKTDIFPTPQALFGNVSRLVGTDGNAKMSKSLGNVINLNSTTEHVKKQVMSMYTDPTRIHTTDKGKVESNPVFIYHNIFNDNSAEVKDLEDRYREGKVGDKEVKEKLFLALEKFLNPIRDRRAIIEKKSPQELLADLIESTNYVRKIAKQTLIEVKEAMKINYEG